MTPYPQISLTELLRRGGLDTLIVPTVVTSHGRSIGTFVPAGWSLSVSAPASLAAAVNYTGPTTTSTARAVGSGRSTLPPSGGTPVAPGLTSESLAPTFTNAVSQQTQTPRGTFGAARPAPKPAKRK